MQIVGSHTEKEPQPKIALGISGGIAAYKSVELARLLVDRGFEVYPIMTEWGARFVGPLTLEALTGNPVRVETPGAPDMGAIDHIALIRSVDLLVIAPLTANTLAKMASGLGDNFLTTTYLAHRGSTLVCPAMNTAMLEHPATQRNLNLVMGDGVHVVMGEEGSLACGETGAGRMAEPRIIAEHIDALLGSRLPELAGKKVLVSAGPTREDLDPVRYISNRSTGRMGFSLARAFRNAGASVCLVHGPVSLDLPAMVEAVPVRSAAQMAEAVLSRQAEMDIIIMAAAVADYRPALNPHKLKKEKFDGVVRLERTTDILDALGKQKRAGQLLIGFAAETQDLIENARDKLQRKNLDYIFANNVASGDVGFASDDNQLFMMDRHGVVQDMGKSSKARLGEEIARLISAGLSKGRIPAP